MRVLLTHNRDLLKHFYSPKAVDLLRAIVDLRMNDSDVPLAGEALVAAAQGCQAIISDRLAAGPREVLERLRGLKAFIRCAVDIRNIVDLALAFAMKVSVYDPYVSVRHGAVRAVGIHELLSEPDFVVCAAYATPETAGMMNADAFA